VSVLIALIMQSQPVVLPAAETAEDEIVVTGNKLDRWRGQFSLRGEKFKCKTTRTSGDKAIDPIGCAAIVQCLVPLRERITQSDDKSLGADRQRALKKGITDELGPCVGATRKVMIAEFVAKRRAVVQ